jgi:protein TonB
MCRWAILLAVLMAISGLPPASAATKAPPAMAAKPDAIGQWQRAVIQRLQPYLLWPKNAPATVTEAAPEVQITIDRAGHILNAKVIRTSGYESFDLAAKKVFKRARILPPPPDEMPGDRLTFTMAVTFAEDRKPGTADQEPVADDLKPDRHR